MFLQWRGIKIYPWIQAARLKTLTAACVPILVATSCIIFVLKPLGAEVLWLQSVCALFSAVFIQVGTNLINDALDYKKGADTGQRLGPQRVTQSGLLHWRHVMFGGWCSFFIAILFAIPLVLHGGFPILFLGILSLLSGYFYTGGPYPLAYIGLGEFFVILFFGFAPVLGVFYLHTGFVSMMASIAGLQMGLLSTVLIALNNLRDSVTDRQAHKMTLAACFGTRFARFEILFLFFIAYCLNFYWFFNGLFWVGFLPFFTLPLSVLLIKGVFTNHPSVVFNSFMGRSAFIHLCFGVLMSAGFFIK
jgi:1,4-dihydroxy-2-naphthoate octaprenyltransferase